MTGRAIIGVLVATGAVVLVAIAQAQRSEPARRACEARTFEGSRFTVCTFDARRDELRLAWRDASGTALRGFSALARELGADAKRVRFAMNAGMYEANGTPVGLLVARGEVLHALDAGAGAGNFYLKPNGVFSLTRDGAVRIVPSDGAIADARWATQSGPMLVIAGALHPAITADGASRKRRNAVGVRDDHTALFVISDDDVSFGRLARLFRDELGCANALFLDGTVSSAWIPGTRQDRGQALGPLVVVLGPR
jgi:uncharacterized protein YigE (DUF2233 family)